jgi:hypothetical protein
MGNAEVLKVSAGLEIRAGVLKGLTPGGLGRVALHTKPNHSRPKSIRDQLREAREHAQTLRNALHLVNHPGVGHIDATSGLGIIS